MSDEPQTLDCYVLPTEEGMPPRAVLGKITTDAEGRPVEGEGALVTWSRDQGAWVAENGTALPPELGEAITAHAKELGVEW
jgi:hypothetical protein